MPAKDGFELQPRDIELLDLTHQLGIATVDHLARHAGSSYHVAYKRAAKLEERHYLSRITKPPAKAIYQLGSEGVQALIEHGHAPESIARRRLRANELKPLGRAHALHIANIHAELLHQAKARPEKIAVWRQDRSLWDQAERRDDEGKPFPVRPDAYFVIEHSERPEGKNRLHFFLEADRATMSVTDAMARKITAYLAYHDEQHFTKKYPGMKAFRVLTITETRGRAKSLAAGLRHLLPTAPLQRAYQFIALEDLTLDAILPAPQL